MFDRENGQAQNAKVNSTQKQIPISQKEKS